MSLQPKHTLLHCVTISLEVWNIKENIDNGNLVRHLGIFNIPKTKTTPTNVIRSLQNITNLARTLDLSSKMCTVNKTISQAQVQNILKICFIKQYLFSGMVRCECCESLMSCETQVKYENHFYNYLKCNKIR